MSILGSILFIVLFLVVLFVLAVLILLIHAAVVTKVPFVSVPREVLPEIVNALGLKSNSVVYDLGCGDGRVLIQCSKDFPSAEYVGIEKDLIPVVCAHAMIRGADGSRIKIIRRDFFDTDISAATHVFVYLFPWMLDKLLPKFKSEIKAGARLVSCDYRFRALEPVKEIDLNRAKGSLGRRLYVYEF